MMKMLSFTFVIFQSIQMALCPEDVSYPSGPLNRKEYRDNLIKTQDSLKGHFASVFRK